MQRAAYCARARWLVPPLHAILWHNEIPCAALGHRGFEGARLQARRKAALCRVALATEGLRFLVHREFPQRLKPHLLGVFAGAAEAAPLHNAPTLWYFPAPACMATPTA